MVENIRHKVGNITSDLIVNNSKILLKHYLFLKYQFKDVDFWGEDSFHRWDDDIARMRKFIYMHK